VGLCDYLKSKVANLRGFRPILLKAVLLSSCLGSRTFMEFGFCFRQGTLQTRRRCYHSWSAYSGKSTRYCSKHFLINSISAL
jgi:hypothetical protein